ncbi:distal membrane-arm assembly complex protein 1-like [Lacerta agilis]|uniref:distal membrane-arm assembly complex protein 1-like n=1 Tax=Lacerta agilis TaxID=80427 RepID=UPI0014194310|nr:distal membrane-arm assembly complex protein 1-like [Lacerta agilis]
MPDTHCSARPPFCFHRDEGQEAERLPGAAIFLPPQESRGMSSSVQGAASSPEQKRSFFWSCFSCRALSGGALIASSFFVCSGPLRIMSHRIPPSMGNIAQMTFAICLLCWGVTVWVNPVGSYKKDE